MNFRNTPRAWGAVSKTLHWVIVLLILMQWVIITRAKALPMGSDKLFVIGMHKSFGMTILMLAILRLVWRWANPVPSLEGRTQGWEHALARLSHVLLYALIFAIPLSGWLMSSARGFAVSWFGQFTFPDLVAKNNDWYRFLDDAHGVLFYTLFAVALVHAAGALKHHFIDRNDVLKRMVPFGRAE